MSFLLLTLQPRSSIKKVNPSSTLFHFSINRKKLKVVSYTIEQSYIGAKGTYKLYVSIVCIAMKLLFVVVVVVVCLVNIQPVESCRKNSQCASGFCIGGGFWKSGNCANVKMADGNKCYKRDGNSCASGHCTCTFCGRKHDNGKACALNSNCKSGFCQDGSVFSCRGVCHSKRADGARCFNGDGNSCVSGQCTCGKCGVKQENGNGCSTHDNCISGNCLGKYNCGGTCRAIGTWE